MNPQEIRLRGNAELGAEANLLNFWQWAFTDICDDGNRGVFAEWMVRVLLDLPCDSDRRVSWANSDIILENGTRIEVKSSALVEAYKTFDEYGVRFANLPLAIKDPKKVRFGRLRARNSLILAAKTDPKTFKSDFYVFCFESQPDPAMWDAWDLSQWEFYVMSRQELEECKIGDSISLATLRSVRTAMSTCQFQEYASKHLLVLKPTSLVE
ncbi:MAG: hypothetical protein LAO20_12885 [Acidobacteriia bacterium]|nr:hypothetical protein [Terriglobia bacterium]